MNKRVGFIPVLLSLGVLVLGELLYHLNFDPVIEFSYFVPIANTVIMLPIAIYFAYVSSVVFERNRDMNILLIGAGILSYGLTTFASGWFLITPTIPVDAPVTIYGIGTLISSVFLFLGASLTINVEAITNRFKQLDAIVYGGLLVVLVIFSYAAFNGILPLFFVNGSGTTVVGTEVLIASFTLFLASLFLFTLLYFRTRSEIIYWNVLAVLMLVLAILSTQGTMALGDILSWDARISQLIGMAYFLISVRVAFNGARG